MKKKHKLSILISLIIHTLFLILIILFAFKRFNKKKSKIILIKNKKKELPASLKPQKSNFGITVFFDDTPKFIPQQTPTEIKKEKNEVNKKKDSTAQRKKKINIKKDDIKVKIKNKTFLTKKKISPQMYQSKEQKIKESVNKSIQKINNTIKEVIQNIGADKQDKTPKIPKRKSLLAMTKGFLQNLKNEGSHWSKRKGDDNKVPTLEELKEDCYNQKIHWCFQNETRILDSKMTKDEKISLLQGLKTNPIIFFEVNENGKLITLKLIQSSGSPKYDKHILQAFKEASPFPPIPKHLNRKTYGGNRKIIQYR